MGGSKLYLGADADYEARQRADGGDIATLHRRSQRIAWGIIMGERVGVDLDTEVDAILRRCGDHFAAHMAAAFARRAQRRDAEAETHLARARALVTADHPWAFLVPDDAKWRETLQPTLEEDEPGRVYRVISDSLSEDTVFNNRGVARFIRMRSGELLYLNPVALSPELAEQVRALGEVTHVIAPSKFHSNHVPLAMQQFPKARAFGVPGHRGYPKVAHIPWSGYLDDDAPLFPDEIDQVTAQGAEFGDVWLIHRATRTLITTDAFLFARLTPETRAFVSAFGVFYGWAWGVFDRTGVATYQPAMWSDIRAYQASIRRMLDLDFDHVATCHSSWRSVNGDAQSVLRRELGWLLALGRFEMLGLLTDFVLRHPGTFMRLGKEKLAEQWGRRGP